MAEIRIIYQIDNAAFDETPLPETKRILDEIKEAMSNGSQGGLIQDMNGNGIGAWVIEGGEERYSEEEEEENSVPCEACMGTGGLEMNGGLSLSNEYFECEICEGVGEIDLNTIN